MLDQTTFHEQEDNIFSENADLHPELIFAQPYDQEMQEFAFGEE